ncbi:MAG TPA: hypothetical protein VGF48_17265, partial [Thermoanaerobaculia bacterium]
HGKKRRSTMGACDDTAAFPQIAVRPGDLSFELPEGTSRAWVTPSIFPEPSNIDNQTRRESAAVGMRAR